MSGIIELNVLLLGNDSDIKICFLHKYVGGPFFNHEIYTIGVVCNYKEIEIDNIKIGLHIYDTSGQERFHYFQSNLFRNSNGIICLYDITDKKSFYSWKDRIKKIKENCPDVKVVIAGYYSDLEEKREVSKETLKNFCERINIKGIEVNLKLGTNISECFEILVKSILGNKSKDELIEKYSKKDKSLKINISKKDKKKKEYDDKNEDEENKIKDELNRKYDDKRDIFLKLEKYISF